MTSTDQPAADLGNWQEPPHNRWSFLHLDQVLATRIVHRGQAPTAPMDALPGTSAAEIEGLSVVRATGAVDTVAGVLRDTETDGMLVLHDGAVAYEHYAPTRDLVTDISRCCRPGGSPTPSPEDTTPSRPLPTARP